MGEVIVEIAIQSVCISLFAVAGLWGMRRGSAQYKRVWLGSAFLYLFVPLIFWISMGPHSDRSDMLLLRNRVIGVDWMSDFQAIQTPLISVWALVAMLLLVRSMSGYVRVNRLAEGATPWAEDYWLAPKVDIPIVCGVFSPRILLPVDAYNWPKLKLDAVLAHERAHIAVNDPRLLMCMNVGCALFWPNPLIWFMARDFRRNAEFLADDAVLESGVPATVYAEHLLSFAGAASKSTWSNPTLPVVRLAGLEERIRKMLNFDQGLRNVSGKHFQWAFIPVILFGNFVQGTAVTSNLLVGSVTGPSGRPIQGAKVEVRDGETVVLKAATSSSGEFSFRIPSAKLYSIEVTEPGMEPMRLHALISKYTTKQIRFQYLGKTYDPPLSGGGSFNRNRKGLN